MNYPAIASTLLLMAFCGQSALAQPVAVAPGRVVSITGGTGLAVRHGNSAARILAVSDPLAPGDELITDAQSEAVIQRGDGSTIHIYPDSRVIFTDQSQGITDFLHLIFGSIKVHIEKLSGRPNPNSLTTPTAVIAVRGTTFSVFVDDVDATLVAVDEGLVAVANRVSPSSEVLLHPGERTWVRGSRAPLKAQAFRGPSERADMMAAMRARMVNSGGMGSAMGAGRTNGMGGMSGRGAPAH